MSKIVENVLTYFMDGPHLRHKRSPTITYYFFRKGHLLIKVGYVY